MDDYISRQAAISAICNACGKIDCDKMDKCEKLQLPPANCSEFPNNSDTISRQAAIDAILGQPPDAHYPDWYASQVKALPAADVVKVVRGRWEKKKDSGLFYCSECGLPSMHKWPYCEQCGAKMDGGES